jgi:hypothetical protein
MTYYKNYIILFGGFQDTSQQTKYLADLWIYDTQNFVWHSPVLPLATQKPDARSSFSFLPHETGAVIFGGYSRVKAVLKEKQTKKGGGQAQRNVVKPMIHQDCFYLKIVQPASDAPPNTPPTVRWERRKKVDVLRTFSIQRYILTRRLFSHKMHQTLLEQAQRWLTIKAAEFW